MKRAGETGYYTYDYLTTSLTNQWVYVEKEVSVPADVVSLNLRIDNNSGGTIWYDEIRLYPSAAQMTTYTYSPLVGIISNCDINNRITYYNYDDFGRLILIKDQDGKLSKQICYNYTGQLQNCLIVSRWVPTGNLRCLTSNGINTGYQEREERDENYNSPTYNQTQWVINGYNTSDCPIPIPCSVSTGAGFSIVTSGISSTGITVSFYIVFSSYGTIMPGNNYLIGTINGSCRPAATRIINYTTAGRDWIITIYPSGAMYWYLASNSTSVPAYYTIGTSTLTFPK
jgi:YD repeat-containing protein